MIKKIFGLLILFFTFLTPSLFCQTINHPSIDTIEVSYMSAPNNQVTPEAIIHFKIMDGVAKVFLKIVNPSDSNVVYSVNYDVNNLPITNSAGLVTCLKNNNIIQIIGTNPIVLQPYTYQIQTEDNQGNISINYTFTRELEP
jgi:hypothetical protein